MGPLRRTGRLVPPEIGSNQMETTTSTTQDPVQAAYEACKDNRTVVITMLNTMSGRVKAMAPNFSPPVRAALAEETENKYIVLAIERDRLDELFAEANPVPLNMGIEGFVGLLEKLAWPLLLVVNDAGVGVHVLRAGEEPQLNSPLMFIAWPMPVPTAPNN